MFGSQLSGSDTIMYNVSTCCGNRQLWFAIELLISCSTVSFVDNFPCAVNYCATSCDGDMVCSDSVTPLCCIAISLVGVLNCPLDTSVAMTSTRSGWEVRFWTVWMSFEALGMVVLSANRNGWTVNVQLGGSGASPSFTNESQIYFIRLWRPTVH